MDRSEIPGESCRVVGAAGQPPGCRNSLHLHRTAEVFFVLKGRWRSVSPGRRPVLAGRRFDPDPGAFRVAPSHGTFRTNGPTENISMTTRSAGQSRILACKRALYRALYHPADSGTHGLRGRLASLHRSDALWRGSHPLNDMHGVDAIDEAVWRNAWNG